MANQIQILWKNLISKLSEDLEVYYHLFNTVSMILARHDNLWSTKIAIRYQLRIHCCCSYCMLLLLCSYNVHTLSLTSMDKWWTIITDSLIGLKLWRYAADYHIYLNVALCGGVREVAENSTGTLQSPNYPQGPTGTPVNCRWVIGAPAGKQVRLTVTNIGITGDCNENYLQFRDQPFITQVNTQKDVLLCSTWLGLHRVQFCQPS